MKVMKRLKQKITTVGKAYDKAIIEGTLATRMLNPAGEVEVNDTVLRIAILDKELRILQDRREIAEVALRNGDAHYKGVIIGSYVHDMQRQVVNRGLAAKAYEEYFASLPWA